MLGDKHYIKNKQHSEDARDTRAQGSAYLAQLLVFMLILLRQYAKICPSLRTIER